MADDHETEDPVGALMVDGLAGRELTEAQPGIYDRPIGIRRQ